MKLPLLAIGIPVMLVCVLVGVAIFLGWSGDLDQPKATVIASCIVPALGFVGFRYQKFLDRGTAALEARRDAYQEYIRLSNAYIEKHVVDGDAPLWPLHSQADTIFLIGSDDVAEQTERHLSAARYFGRVTATEDPEIFDGMRSGLETQQAKLIGKMRLDLKRGTSFAPSLQNER